MKENHSNDKANKFGMVIDLDKCTGCGACMVACMSENNVPFKKDESKKLDSITWMHLYRLTNKKPFPDTEVCYLPRPCMHCEGAHGHPPCVSVCPATATDYDKKTGIVSQIYTRCFGCRYCMGACPYHARYFNWWDPVWPEGMENYLSPNVSPRMRGVVEKCSLCFHRYQLAMDKAYHEGRKELEEHEYQSSCTQACPAGAITFGDLNNPHHQVHKMVKPSKHGGKPTATNAFRLLERLGTNPKIYYLSSKEWVRRLGDNYLPEEKTGEIGNHQPKGHH
ncbi:MAG: 4Fe-4S dicluster domain-containing protein [Proteobacteria bacterium]|nr:4Fe-4S dicluster domain-containing protein [Pseudomonadota bacterium]